ncbi:MAG: hypothetical protein NZ777_07375, partial [Pseudomonadales bacterium]|nr:hypothetical protein [Pseudomonadales bacterium]
SIRNIKANGIRLSTKELASCTIVEPGGKQVSQTTFGMNFLSAGQSFPLSGSLTASYTAPYTGPHFA